jgi:hypothetical protein
MKQTVHPLAVIKSKQNDLKIDPNNSQTHSSTKPMFRKTNHGCKLCQANQNKKYCFAATVQTVFHEHSEIICASCQKQNFFLH